MNKTRKVNSVRHKTNTVVYVYGLCEPETDNVRYIGSSVNPKERYHGHLSASRLYGSSPKEKWICALLEQGKKPTLKVFAATTERDRDRLESAYAYYFYSKGHNLLNDFTCLSRVYEEIKVNVA